MSELDFFLIAVVASAAAVWAVRRFALAHGVLDHPTTRGSHDVATPRGGGLGAIAVTLVAFTALNLSTRDVRIYGCIGACVAIALVGWFDDWRGLSVRARLFVHLLGGIAVGALALVPERSLALKIVSFVAWAFWTVSSINFVNFMDGINGFVASQVAIFAISLMLFGWEEVRASWYAAAVGAACLGFLPWNFPRARIFLGDVGSGALGFLVPVLALITMRERDISLIQAYLPLLPLFGDATVTILRRWRRGEKLTEAHRNHLYQRIANGGAGHTKVTLMFASASCVGAILAHYVRPALSWQLAATYVALLLLVGTLLEWRLKSELT